MRKVELLPILDCEAGYDLGSTLELEWHHYLPPMFMMAMQRKY